MAADDELLAEVLAERFGQVPDPLRKASPPAAAESEDERARRRRELLNGVHDGRSMRPQ